MLQSDSLDLWHNEGVRYPLQVVISNEKEDFIDTIFIKEKKSWNLLIDSSSILGDESEKIEQFILKVNLYFLRPINQSLIQSQPLSNHFKRQSYIPP